MTDKPSSSKTFDTAIIGAGIMGLWAARHAIRRGERVVVLEKRDVGAGASGGFLGALMPHMPDSWNAKKQYQYDGLVSIETAIRALETDTGHDCGYRRCGRIIPLKHEKLLSHMQKRIDGANMYWAADYALQWVGPEKLDSWAEENNMPQNWISAERARFGIQHDTLAARVDPRAYLGALAAYVSKHAELRTGDEVVAIMPAKANANSQLVLAAGDGISAHNIVLAAGWEAYPLAQPFLAGINHEKPIGRGVKGQAVLLNHEHGDTAPIVYDDGVYVVPQRGNRIAVGSTSSNDWQGSNCPAPDGFDPQETEFVERARKLVPALSHAPIMDRWAAVRPRNTIEGQGTAPYFSRVPDHENFYALLGGFKITFALAHLPFSQYAQNGGFFPTAETIVG